MKKTLIIFTALVTVLCGIMFSSCQHSYVADEGTWYKTTTSVKEVDVKLWFYYSSENLTLKTFDGTKPIETTYDPGLTIVAIPDYPGVATYTVKHFNTSNTEEEVVDEEDTEAGTESVKIKASGTFMDALYIKYKADFKESASTSAPSELSSKTYQSVENISKLTDKFEGIGWRSILKEIVNNVL